MTESIDNSLPHVGVAVPCELGDKIAATSLNQGAETPGTIENFSQLPLEETTKHTTTDPTDANQSPGFTKNENPEDAEDRDSSNDFEKFDPVDDWYLPEIEKALRNSAWRRTDNEPNTNKLVPIFSNDPEVVPDGKEREQLYVASPLSNQSRPYMSKRARDFIRLMENWNCFSGYEGRIIHIAFSASEIDIVFKALSDQFTEDSVLFMPGDLSEVSASTWLRVLMSKLKGPESEEFERFLEDKVIPKIIIKGRTAKDILLFFQDCIYSEPDDSYIRLSANSAGESAKRISSSAPFLRLRQELGYGERAGRWNADSTIRKAKAACMEYLQPQAFFTGGSSDIIDIRWSPNGRRFALSSATLNDIYNRPGNPMLGSVERLEVKLLDGHKTPRPIEQRNPTLDNQLRSTVTRVAFSNDGSRLYSSGYDATIKTWDTKDGVLLDSVDLKGPVVTMCLSKPHNVIAGSTDNGWLERFPTDINGDKQIAKFRENGQLYAPTLIWADRINPNWLFAGYENRSENGPAAGLCVVYDASVNKRLNSIRPSTGRHFDMFLHQEASILVTGVSRSETSLIRMYDIRLSSQSGRGPQSSVSGKVKCPQRDINVVTMSLCERCITSSGTNNSTVVWDSRNLVEPLTQLWHGDTLMPITPDTNLEAEDTGTTFAQWCPHDGYLYTGGSDGVVKAWDVTGANPLVRNLPTLDAQIMSGEFSPEFDKLLIGSASGKATLFSMDGRRGDALAEFSVDMSGIIQDLGPDAGSVSQNVINNGN